MSYRNSTTPENHGEEGSQHGASAGSHGEDSGSTYGSSSHTMQRTYKGADSVISANSALARHRVGSDTYSSVPTGTGLNVSSSGNVTARHTGGSSTGYTSGSTLGQGGGYSSSSTTHTAGSTGGNRATSGGYTSGSTMGQGGSYSSSSTTHPAGSTGGNRATSGGYTSGSTMGQGGSYSSSSTTHTAGSTGGNRATSAGYTSGSTTGYGGSTSASGSSGGRLGVNSSSSSVPKSGGASYSGGFSSRSTGGFFSRSTGGRQGYASGFCGPSGSGGFGGFSSGSLTGQRGGFSSGSLCGGEGLLQAGEKETMQNLNTRLSAYMDKVRALEDSNSELEVKIRNWYETHKPKNIDNSKFYKMIEDLKEQIINATLENNQLTVEVDNSRLAADDFRVKYESEFNMRQSVEADIERLRKVLDDLTLEKASLESQVENLREEIAFNKKNHEEEMKSMQGQTSDVSVQVDAAPGINILKVLNDIRSQYEDMAEVNRKKAEEEYNHKITELSNEIYYSSAELETGKSEAAELRRTMQTMEIELQSQLAMKCSLENALGETQARYAHQLAQIQEMISNLEEQLAQVRSEMENESCEYNLLLDIKNRLENEIEMYRRLLDGESSSSSNSGNGYSGSGSGSSSAERSSRSNGSSYSSSSSSSSMGVTDPKKNRLVTTITEERVDGRLVSSKVDKIPQKA